MGIDKFFNSLKNKISSIKKSGITINFKDTITTDYSYIDFNSVIYTTVSEIEEELNYVLYSLILQQFGVPFDEVSKEFSKKWNYNLENASLQTYKDYFSAELIDKSALENIKKYVIMIATKLCSKETLKLLYISIDGVPQLAKKVEQKKRRCNGFIISKLKAKIFEKYESALPSTRKLYEDNKLSYDRGKIISWTPFMKSVQLMLSSDELSSELRAICPIIQEIILSHQDVYGEGEKKIMEHILENKKVGNYTIFSPDADTIILGIIAQNQLNNGSNVTVLRHNQQTKEYDTVNIDLLSDSMFEYVKNKTQITNPLMTKLTVSNDISFMFTLFGNDFIPKVESIDVRNDIDTLIDAYCSVIKKSSRKCLIYTSQSGHQRINYYNFAELIKVIANMEGDILNETYMSHKYKNYNYYKKEIGVTKLLPVLEAYIPVANKIFECLRANISIDTICATYGANVNFVEKFLIFESNNYKKLEINNPVEMREKFKLQLEKIITYATENKKEIRGRLFFQIHDVFSPESSFHKKNIMEGLSHPNMELCDIDIECYKLERKLGEYETKLNAGDLDLGAIKLLTDEKGNYSLRHYSRQNGIMKYYKNFFDINGEIKVVSQDDKKYSLVKTSETKQVLVFDEEKMTLLVEDYLKGLFWVFDNYFNKNSSKHNSTSVSTWIYTHHRSPLMYQVKEVLFKFAASKEIDFVGKLNKLYDEVTINTKYIYGREMFMNKLEHYMYVTPMSRMIDIPDKYKQFIEDNKDFFPDLDAIANKIWESTDNSDVIDCKRISFLSKCNLLSVKFVNFEEYMKKIFLLRENEENEDIEEIVNMEITSPSIKKFY